MPEPSRPQEFDRDPHRDRDTGEEPHAGAGDVVPSGVPAAFLAMIEALPPEEAGRMFKLLRARLAPPESPREYRERELRSLATLLETTGALDRRPVRVDRLLYDETRTPPSLTSGQLVERYGTWMRACAAAASLDPSGGRRPGSPSLPWANSNRGRIKPAPYERWEIIAAIRACAEALGEWPSCHVYEEWVMERRRRALRAGEWPIRLPRDRVIERVFGSWAIALTALRAPDL